MAANPIYIETEEEIPEVIERVRLSTAEDTTLVLPTRSRFGQSRFNFQLLRQYASGMGKRVAIVSPDPAVQQMAEEHGFRSYRAVELVGGEAEPESGAAAPTAGEGAAAAERPLPLPPPRPAGGVAPAPRMVMGAPARLPSRLATEMRPGHTLLYAGAGLLLIAGLVAGFIYVPAADITLTAAATSFEQPVTVDAQPGQPPVRVRAAKVEKTASGAFKATGTQKVPGVLATGSVIISNSCPIGMSKDVPGTRLRGTGGIQFMITTPWSVDGNGHSPSLPIKATAPGVAGNLPPGSVTVIEINPGGCLTVTNPDPTSGGVDDKTNTIIQPSDLDTARQGLEAQLRKDIGDDLARGLQPGEKLAESPLFSPPDFNPDHKLGDVVTGFNATLRLSAEGAYYNEADVQKAFADGLARKVPADKSLTDNRVAANYTVDQGTGAHMTFRGTARSFLAPRIDFNRLSGQLAAKSTGQAKAVLGKLPVESADLKQTPVRLPFMPLSSSRIHIRYVVEQGAAPAVSPAPRKTP